MDIRELKGEWKKDPRYDDAYYFLREKEEEEEEAKAKETKDEAKGEAEKTD